MNLKQKLKSGTRCIGAFLVLPDDVVAETASLAGFDYVVIDTQHGLIDYDTMRRMVLATELGGAAAIVRVAPGDDYAVGRALDAGAEGLIVPLVNDAGDIEKAVAAANYGPAGNRSFGPMRALIREGTRYVDTFPERLVILPQIETGSGLGNLDEITCAAGIDGVYVGPMDLSIALGLHPTLDSTEKVFVEAIDSIVTACRTAGIAPVMHAEPTLATKWFAKGFTGVTVASDIGVVKQGFAAAIEGAEL